MLVGDPKQLPPTVLSRAAESSNLAQSLFERLQQVTLLPQTQLLCESSNEVQKSDKDLDTHKGISSDGHINIGPDSVDVKNNTDI